MDKLKAVKQMLEKLLDEFIEKGDLDAHDVEMLDKVIDEIKDIETICAMRENSYYGEADLDGYSRGRGGRGYNDGYSGARYYDGYSGNRYTNGMMYDGMYMGEMPRRGYSGAQGGQYSNRMMGGYSRDDSQKRMIGQLERLMDEAQSDHARMAINDAIQRLEQ